MPAPSSPHICPATGSRAWGSTHLPPSEGQGSLKDLEDSDPGHCAIMLSQSHRHMLKLRLQHGRLRRDARFGSSDQLWS